MIKHLVPAFHMGVSRPYPRSLLVALGLSFWSFRIYLQGKMLPHTRIIISERHRAIDKESLMLFFTILGALGTLAGVIVTVFFALNTT